MAEAVTDTLMHLLRILALALLWPGQLLAQSVAVNGGDLFYHAAGQSPPRRLTSSGLDRQPQLSPDGLTVAFVRATPGDSVETGSGREEATALWVVRTDGSGARMLVRGRYAELPERTLAGIQAPQFSPDGKQVYFLTSAWATSGAVHAVDLASGRERFIVAGNSLEVIPSGEYAGHLLVEQHRYFVGGGAYDWVWLLTPEGREVGPVGESEEAVEEFRSLYVGPGSVSGSPAAPPGTLLPARVRGRAPRPRRAADDRRGRGAGPLHPGRRVARPGGAAGGVPQPRRPGAGDPRLHRAAPILQRPTSSP